MKRSAFPLVWGRGGRVRRCRMPSARQASGVMRRAVGRAVVGDHALDGDAVAGVERQRAAQERDGGGGLLVGQDFGVGQAGGVVDRDVNERPSRLACAADAGGVGASAGARGCWRPVTRLPGAAADPPELLDVDVDQLAGPLAFIALARALGRAGRNCPSRSA